MIDLEPACRPVLTKEWICLYATILAGCLLAPLPLPPDPLMAGNAWTWFVSVACWIVYDFFVCYENNFHYSHSELVTGFLFLILISGEKRRALHANPSWKKISDEDEEDTHIATDSNTSLLYVQSGTARKYVFLNDFVQLRFTRIKSYYEMMAHVIASIPCGQIM